VIVGMVLVHHSYAAVPHCLTHHTIKNNASAVDIFIHTFVLLHDKAALLDRQISGQ
jgi:hypothetical protein